MLLHKWTNIFHTSPLHIVNNDQWNIISSTRHNFIKHGQQGDPQKCLTPDCSENTETLEANSQELDAFQAQTKLPQDYRALK